MNQELSTLFLFVYPPIHFLFNPQSCWCVIEFLAEDPEEVPGSILGATRFSEDQCVWNGVHSALARINEELLERKVAAPV
jgi:hypothetical protein